MPTNPSIILKKLGLSEDDFKTSQMLFQEMPPPPPFCEKQGHKVEVLLGYSHSRLRRSKALKVLGTSEEKIEEENSKNLGALGMGGRRRSFIVKESESKRDASFSHDSREDSSMSRKRRGGSFTLSLKKKSRSDIVRRKKRYIQEIKYDKKSILEDQMNNLKVALNDAKIEISFLSQRVAYLEERQKKEDATAQH